MSGWQEPAWSAAMPLPWYAKTLEFRWEALAGSWGDREQREYGAFLTGLASPHGPAFVEVEVGVRVEPPRPRDLFGAHDLCGMSGHMLRPTITLSCRALARVAVGVKARGGEAYAAAHEERGRADARLVAIGAALCRVGKGDRGNVIQGEFEPASLLGDWQHYDAMPDWWAPCGGMPTAAAQVGFGTPFGPEGGLARRRVGLLGVGS